jgi:hypothetical protein
LEELKKEIEDYFTNTYGAETNFLTIKITTGRGLLLKFHVGDELSSGHPSKQVHVKIDLNHFVASKTVTERRPINQDQLSFVILTYNMSALMASKLAAIFLRGTRGIGSATYEEKGRDIYDLLWYMNKKIVPDLDYLVAKGIDVKDPRMIFDKLTLQMNKVSDDNLKQDLSPLFVNRGFIESWLKNWRESYLRLLDDYKIRTVVELDHIAVDKDFRTDIFSFKYWYKTTDSEPIKVAYTISDEWINLGESSLPIEIDPKSIHKVTFLSNETKGVNSALKTKLNLLITLFYQKTEKYLKKTNRIVLGDNLVTKVIRMTADNLNQKEQIVLNKSTLMSCELDDLLK